MLTPRVAIPSLLDAPALCPATTLRRSSSMLLPTTTIRKRWKGGESSCSREVDVSHLNLRRKRVWWPCGPAREQFDTQIVPRIEDLLKNVDLDEADIYLRLYMIGKSRVTTWPVVMVCCSNARVRDQVEKEIRESQILRQCPGFKLGASALPLDQQGPIQPLAGTPETGSIPDGQISVDPSLRLDPSYSRESVNISPAGPLIGRRLRIAHELGASSPSRLVTGGVIVRIDDLDLLCQLTASHEATESPSASSFDGSDQCHFDGMDDEDEEEDGRTVAPAAEHRIHTPLGRFPLSPEPNSWDVPGDSPTLDDGFGCPSTPIASQPLGPQRDQPPLPSERVFNTSQRLDPKLDYAMVPLVRSGEAPSGEQMERWRVNTITLGGEDSSRTMQIRRVSHIGSEERKIIAITGSRGVTRGVLLPAPLYFRTAALPRFQALYSVHLQGSTARGDSGSAVVDEVTGDLYGHIVRGTPGSRTAYIIAAVEVVEDLGRKTRSSIQLAVPANDQGFLAAPDYEPVQSVGRFALAQPTHYGPRVEPRHGRRIEAHSPMIEDDLTMMQYLGYREPDFWSDHPTYLGISDRGSSSHGLSRSNYPEPFRGGYLPPSTNSPPEPYIDDHDGSLWSIHHRPLGLGSNYDGSLGSDYFEPLMVTASEPTINEDPEPSVNDDPEPPVNDDPGQSRSNYRQQSRSGHFSLSR